jgi:hypothetical protein
MSSDLQTRKTTREEAWKVEGWSDTVYKTGNLPFHNHKQVIHHVSFISSLG